MGQTLDIPCWWLAANWPTPARVRAGITTRVGGDSKHPYQGFNLALHVGDNPEAVVRNRSQLRQGLHLPQEPCWLQQVHGKQVIFASDQIGQSADGSITSGPGHVCAVQVADCVPLLLADTAGIQVAAIHAGWRGIAAGIIDAAVSAMSAPAEQLLAWIGPCIGPDRYEVGSEVRAACLQAEPGATRCFESTTPDHWRADLRQLVSTGLRRRGIARIYGNDNCVAENSRLFYSHRRDGRTGRMAALIWIEMDQP